MNHNMEKSDRLKFDTEMTLRKFAGDMGRAQELCLRNRHGGCAELTLRRLEPKELAMALNFQEEVASRIPGNDTEKLLQRLSEEEFRDTIGSGCCVGLFDGGQLMAVLSFIPEPSDAFNLLLDLDPDLTEDPHKVMIADFVLVHERYRGYGIQRLFILLTEYIAREKHLPVLAAVANPKNSHSCQNLRKSGFQLIDTLPKYDSMRSFFLKRLN